MGVKLLRQKPQHKQWVQEELHDSFAKAISVKFFHTLATEEKGNLRTLLRKALEFEERECAIRASEERDKCTSIDASESSENPVHAVSDVSPISRGPEYSKSRTGMRYRRISKLCYTCNSPNHLQRFCDKSRKITPRHTRDSKRPYVTALLNCFRCGSNHHGTAECYRNHKLCFRCQYRGHVAIECVSIPNDRQTTRRNNGQRSKKTDQTNPILDQKKDSKDADFTMAHHNSDLNLSPNRTYEEPICSRREMLIDKNELEQPVSNFIGGLHMDRLSNAEYHSYKKLEELLRRCD